MVLPFSVGVILQYGSSRLLRDCSAQHMGVGIPRIWFASLRHRRWYWICRRSLERVSLFGFAGDSGLEEVRESMPAFVFSLDTRAQWLTAMKIWVRNT